jgi:membrane-associated phospholipid phosphatase
MEKILRSSQTAPARVRPGQGWLLEPARNLVLLVAVATLAGTFLIAIAGAAGPELPDSAARLVPGLHDGAATDLMLTISSFGEEIVLAGLFGILVLYAYRARGVSWGRFVMAAMVGALSLDNLIKPLVGRARPAFGQLVPGTGDSFPSGHVTGTTALLLVVAYFVSSGRTGRSRLPIWAIAIGGSLLMGVSRIYLGVHWPTDVIAGLLLGGTWTFVCARSFEIKEAEMIRRPTTYSRRMAPAVVALAVMSVACSSSSSEPSSTRSSQDPEVTAATNSKSADTYQPNIDPADFVSRIDNPYFPLIPGTVFHLRGETEDGVETEAITVTECTKEVMGVRTTVINDVVKVDGKVVEATLDWYAQDVDGNVWYFGEDTAEYENGKIINRHGAWEAGVDGAQPGIIMSADPQVLDSYRQEYYEGEAEDMFWVVGTGESLSVPLGEFDDVVRVLEFNPLEPRVVVEKRYAPGIGLLVERALSGGKENVELLEIIEPGSPGRRGGCRL